MDLESLLDPPEPIQLTGTKRVAALSDVGRETKRHCTQLGELPSGSAVLELGNEYNFWESFSIASNSEFGNASLHYGIDPKMDWSNTLPPGIVGGLDSASNLPAAESNPSLSGSMPAQMCETNTQSSCTLFHQPEIQDSTNTFDLHYSFEANNTTDPSLNVSHDPNFSYSGNLFESWILPDSNCSPFPELLTENTSTWIDTTTVPQNGNEYQPTESFAPQLPETAEIAPKGEGTLVIGLEEARLMGNEDASGYFSKVASHNKDLQGLHNSSSQPALSEPAKRSLPFDSNQIDICFGVIIAYTTSTWTGDKGMKVTPVTLSPFGDVMKLSFQDSRKYAGILALPALCKLQEEFNIDYTANMVASGSRKDQRTTSGKATPLNSAHDCSVRIVVYGVKSEQHSVGQLLSDAGLYLQHPSAAELYRHVDYWNPHYLLRPGSQMPSLEALSISPDVNNVTRTDSMDETHKSRFMQIFNSANGSSSSLSPTCSPRLKSALKDHEVTALAMMTEKECGIVENPQFPSLWNPLNRSGSILQYRHKVTGTCQSNPIPVYGGILADEMGLGKTLSLLALVCSSLDSVANQEDSPTDGISRATLIVTPKSTIPGWQQQVERHIHAGQMRLAVYHGSSRRLLPSEFWKTDIILTTYETLRSEWAARGPLYSGTWRRVVLDEAHHIRNRSSQLFKAASAVASKSRWCLTGTPIHNSLDDYGALLSFIGVPLLMEKSQFDLWITSPIKQKRPNSFSILGDLIRATCLRRTKDITQDSLKLPRRIERIEEIELHEADQALYHFFREKTAKIAAGLASQDRGTFRPGEGKGANILTLINFLRRICNNGEDLLPQSALEAWRSENSTSVDWQMMRNCNKTCDSCGSTMEDVDLLSDDSLEFSCHHSVCTACSMQNENTPMDIDEVRKCPKCAAIRATPENTSTLPESNTRLSAKVEALIRVLDAQQTLEHHADSALAVKSVIFSHWTKMLDLIANALKRHGFRFQRIDGQSSLQQRNVAIQQFMRIQLVPSCLPVSEAQEKDLTSRVDLTAANHVHLVEPHWSPMAEAQAVDRVHRIGQSREVTVTRYIASNTIETYIQWVQQDKLRLINRSLDSAEVLQGDIDNARWKTLQRVLDVSNQ
ncbi:uncharacterized protein PAC_10004 [Phialocephala subalpina]|uniref:Helicase-like transcription factor protein n=1 Tax=Phialocephala subalpina TaxID=576137 RepID=A0A1L7X504_9HELO|nr:uncharacterized protein PAC_10004 [Phialocephala subalpina]